MKEEERHHQRSSIKVKEKTEGNKKDYQRAGTELDNFKENNGNKRKALCDHYSSSDCFMYMYITLLCIKDFA